MLRFHLFQTGTTHFAMIFFRKLLNPCNCIHHLLPPLRDAKITSRLRKATTYPRPRNRTNCYKSFIHHALLKYQQAYITLLDSFLSSHCIAFYFLSCIVLLYSALVFVQLLDFQPSGYKFNKTESEVQCPHLSPCYTNAYKQRTTKSYIKYNFTKIMKIMKTWLFSRYQRAQHIRDFCDDALYKSTCTITILPLPYI